MRYGGAWQYREGMVARRAFDPAQLSFGRTLGIAFFSRTLGLTVHAAGHIWTFLMWWSGAFPASQNIRIPIGRLAQRESTPFTREGSLVQSQYRPPRPPERAPLPGDAILSTIFLYFPMGLLSFFKHSGKGPVFRCGFPCSVHAFPRPARLTELPPTRMFRSL